MTFGSVLLLLKVTKIILTTQKIVSIIRFFTTPVMIFRRLASQHLIWNTTGRAAHKPVAVVVGVLLYTYSKICNNSFYVLSLFYIVVN